MSDRWVKLDEFLTHSIPDTFTSTEEILEMIEEENKPKVSKFFDEFQKVLVEAAGTYECDTFGATWERIAGAVQDWQDPSETWNDWYVKIAKFMDVKNPEKFAGMYHTLYELAFNGDSSVDMIDD